MTNNDLEKLETMMWQGESEFSEFVHVAKTIGYKYVVRCTPLDDELPSDLGSACKDHAELVDILIEFSDLGYASRVARVDVVDFEQLN